MTATAQTPLGQPKRSYPRITQETRDALRNEEMRVARNPELNTPAAPLSSDRKYVFRTYPRTVRGLQHFIDTRPEGLDESVAKDRHTLRRWDWHHRNDTPEHRALVQHVFETNGGSTLKFRPIPRRFECFYETDDDKVAEYIRGLIAKGHAEFQWVYEQSPRVRLVAGDKAFPNTEMGHKAALQYAREQGVTSIEIVDERESAPSPVAYEG